MAMDLSDLEIFCAVVKAGGVIRAAERLHRVPSNVTTRIRQLEDNVGVQLFLREGNRLRIAPAGEILLVYAERMLDLAGETREALQDTSPRGRLTLGTMESTAAVRLPAPLAEYHRLYPEVKLELHTGSTRTLMTRVISGELETALVADPVPDERLGMKALFKEELFLVTDPDHPKIVSPRDCVGDTVLAFADGCTYRKRLEDWFSANNKVPDRVMEISSYHVMLGCVVSGMGIALLPKSVLEALPEHSRVSTHRLSGDWRLSTTYMIWRNGVRSARVEALGKVLQGRKS